MSGTTFTARMTPRNAAMIAAYMEGDSLEVIGKAHGLTRERVRQICTTFGVTKATRPETSAKWVPFDRNDYRFRYGWSNNPYWWGVTRPRMKAIRRKQIETMRAWVAATGVANPSMYQVADVLGTNIISLAKTWGRDTRLNPKRDKSYHRYWRRFFRLVEIRQDIPRHFKVYRDGGPRRGHAANCLRGHPMSGDNLYVSPHGQRGCHACRRLRYGTKKTRHT